MRRMKRMMKRRKTSNSLVGVEMKEEEEDTNKVLKRKFHQKDTQV
jgi:hypothetical protein